MLITEVSKKNDKNLSLKNVNKLARETYRKEYKSALFPIRLSPTKRKFNSNIKKKMSPKKFAETISNKCRAAKSPVRSPVKKNKSPIKEIFYNNQFGKIDTAEKRLANGEITLADLMERTGFINITKVKGNVVCGTVMKQVKSDCR